MATPFEEFVNTELPKRLTINTLPVSGNLPAFKTFKTTGVGLQAEVVDFPVSGSSILFRQAKFLVDSTLQSTKNIIISDPLIENSETVAINGVLLSNGVNDDYTVSGNTIIFNPTLELYVDDMILIKYATA